MRFLFNTILVFTLVACQTRQFRDEIYSKPKIDPHPPLVERSPEESLKRLYLPAGFKAEIVAHEPMLDEPVAITWDGDGRMFVAQMVTYMQDADGTAEDLPISRVSLLEDTNGDGVMDKDYIFIDSLILPRIMLALDDRLIVGETFNRSLYAYRDTNSDNVADEKVLIYSDTVKDNRNLEHQDANMIWSIDNWLYVTNRPFRFRFENNRIVRDTLPEAVAGQWGLTQDEEGRIFYSRAGTEIPALGFQQHPSYGNLELDGRWEESFMEPWPIVGTPDVQGGPKRMRPDSTLNRFTAVAGQEIFLGDKLPGAYGDLFIPEPVGRLIRRAKVNHVDGQIILKNAYDKAEFIASTDPMFRPVFAATGPDGCLYVVDMYRGIIQEGTWVREGSYLRDVVNKKGYDKFTSKGRIYRIRHEAMEPGEMPQLLDKSAADLVGLLGHPNGWWRMTAQKLIVLKNDQTVVKDLKNIVDGNDSFFDFFAEEDDPIERLHAFWTLEGLKALDRETILSTLNDKDHRLRVAAIRNCEQFIRANDEFVITEMERVANDQHPEVLQQVILSLRMNNNEQSKSIVRQIASRHPDNVVIAATAAENLSPAYSELQAIRAKYQLWNDGVTGIIAGYHAFQEYCATCHGKDGKGIAQLAPPLIGSPRVTGNDETLVKILLHGLTGPVDGKEYTGPMAPIAQESDEHISNVISYIRTHLNDRPGVWRGRIGRIREKYQERKKYWTIEELKREEAAMASN